MKLLLDTHTFLWYADGNPRLSATAALLLADPANELHLSMASAWEVAVKVGLGKLALSAPYRTYLNLATTRSSLNVVPITLDDCVAYEALPFPLKNHRDPFDRMIITHAQQHGLGVVGADAAFDAYGVSRLW